MRSSDLTLLTILALEEYIGSCGEEKAMIESGTTQLRSPCLSIYSNSKLSKVDLEYQLSCMARSIPIKQSMTVSGKSSGPTPASLKGLNDLR